MNVISNISREINIRAFERKTQRVLRLISILECGNFTRKELMLRLDISQATLYRLLAYVSQVLWNYEVIHDDGRYCLVKRVDHD